MTTENTDSAIEAINPTPEPQSTAVEAAPLATPSNNDEGMSAESISKLTDEELNSKLDAPPIPKAPEPKVESEIEVLRRRVEEQKQFIGKQTEEVRQARELMQKNSVPPPPPPQNAIPAPESKIDADQLTALFLEDPRMAMAVLDAERQAQANEQLQAQSERSKMLNTIAPNLQENAETIARLMKDEDGLTDEQILHIAKNVDKIPPDILYAYNQRANMAKKFAAYEKEIAELKGKPDRLLNKIEAAQKPRMTSSSGQANPLTINGSKNPEAMSDNELQEALKRSGIN